MFWTGDSRIWRDCAIGANGFICSEQVIAEYDLIVLLEVTDSSEQAIPTLLSKLSVTDQDWAYELSPRIGRTSYKEQSVFCAHEEIS